MTNLGLMELYCNIKMAIEIIQSVKVLILARTKVFQRGGFIFESS